MVEFLKKFQNCGFKIARVNAIRITKSINLLQFCAVLGVRCDVDILTLSHTSDPIGIQKTAVFYASCWSIKAQKMCGTWLI